jgi:hypothetical protein
MIFVKLLEKQEQAKSQISSRETVKLEPKLIKQKPKYTKNQWDKKLVLKNKQD